MLPHPELDFRRTPVTLLVAAVAVALEVVCTLDPPRREVYAETWKLGMLSLVWSWELWRPMTTTLLHGSLIHVAFNVYWLMTFGRVLEPYFGSGRYLGVLCLLACTSTMPSFLANNWSTALDEQVSGVGLSGVVYGLFGILWIGQRFRRSFQEVCSAEVIQTFVAWFFFCIVLTYLEILPIDNVAHGVGCAVGLLYGEALFEPTRRLFWRALAVLVTALGIGWMFAAPGHPLYEKHMRNEAIRMQIKEIEAASQASEAGNPEAADSEPAADVTEPSGEEQSSPTP
ncbi:MAG: rhomboid family intramembrane serine protease [Thermoguttaceae bacterium]